MFNVILVEPKIPQNTGNIVRLCTATGMQLIIVGEPGFSLSNRYLKRAGLDYWEFIQIKHEPDVETYLAQLDMVHAHLLTTKVKRPYQHIKPNGKWADKWVIIFSEYRATQNWLQTMLAAAGFTTGGRLQTLFGGMDPEKREQVKAAFQTHPEDSPVRILLATDAASEGIDLQRHCYRLFHMEIPWNPNRLEQRNGRIDRHGQLHSPLVHHFVGKGYQKRQHDPASAPSELEAD